MLGSPIIKVGGEPLRLSYLKAEALLYYLGVTGRPHSRPALATLLWCGSPEDQARNSLRNALYEIRKGLKPAMPLLVDRDAVSLDMALVWLDVQDFRATLKHKFDDPTALSKAVALWRGTFLDGLYLPEAASFEEWVADQRTQLEALYQQGLDRLAQLYLSQKRFQEAQQVIERLLALDPLYEAGHQQLMRLYLQTGNRVAALRQYESLRQLLVEELGVDPAPATQALHLELLQADEPTIQAGPSVDLPARPLGRYQFVGRKREMGMLSEFYRRILPNGPACLVMLEGEPGIGKTRLAREWLATVAYARILTTRCFEAEQAIPFQPWIDLLRTTLKQTAWSKPGLADVWLTELANLLPEIRLQRPDLELSPLNDPELARGRIIQAIFHWLELLCRREPVCIFIDDWQWLDQASLTLLRYILHSQQSSHLPLMILGAQREAETMPGWPQFRTALEREGILHPIKLYRLSLADVAVLARSITLPKTIQTDTFLVQLLAETEGNPLFITEFLQALTLEALETEAWPMPPTIQTVIKSRLSHLSKTTYQIISAAAVIGRSFTDTLLQQIVNFPQEEILQALDEAIESNLIIEQENTCDFTHDKIRTVLLDALTRSRRRHLHLRIATALEATLSNDFGRLSYHFEMGGDNLRTRTYGLQAARQTVELYADEDALYWYAKVEALADNTEPELSPAAIPKVTPFQHMHVSPTLPLDVPGLIYRQRGLILQRIGRYDQAEDEFQAALARAKIRDRRDEQAAAHNLLSFLAYLRSDYDGVGWHAQIALDLATQAGEVALRAPGLQHLGIAVYRTGDYARARRLYDEALDAYRQAGDKLGLAGVYNNIGFVLRTQASYTAAIEAFEQALTIYESTGQIEGVALICSNIGRTYAFSGDLKQAQRYLERGLALSVESHTDWITVKIHRTMGNIFAQNGQWSRALAHAQQAQSLAATLGSDEDLGAALRLLAEIARVWPERNLGDPATYFEQSVALLQQVGAQDEMERAEAAYADYLKAAGESS
ncbi:MAG: tetratricopeptide repeat protein [Chloroflexota bacterium]